MIGLNCGTATGELTINGVSMHTRAWCCTDLLELWTFQSTRGENVTLPGAAGRRPYPVRIEEAHYSLPMGLTGRVDRFGVPASDHFLQLQANIDYLRANVVDPTVDATVPATLLMPDGTTRTADVQVLALTPGVHGAAELALAVLELRVPAGRFA